MKNLLIFVIPFIFISYTQPIQLPSNTFEQDMLESIMEFANDSIPADSLYIPDWL